MLGKVTKKNFDLVSGFIRNLNDCIAPSASPTILKWAVMLCKFTEKIPRTQKNHRPMLEKQKLAINNKK